MNDLLRKNGTICFVCQVKADDLISIQGTITTSSETSILDIFERFFDGPTGSESDIVLLHHKIGLTAKICKSCLDKVNSYDIAYESAERIRNELASLIVKGNGNVYMELPMKYEGEFVINDYQLDEVSIECREKQNGQSQINATVNILIDHLENPIVELLEDLKSEPKYDDLDSEPKYENEIDKKTLENKGLSSITDLQSDKLEPSRINTAVTQKQQKLTKGKIALRKKSKELENTPVSLLKCTHKGCQAVFRSSKEFLAHRKELGHKKYLVCGICEQRFDAKSRYMAHMAFHSGGDSPFECDICGKKLAQHAGLMRHRRIHTGEKAYQCDHCGKQFIHETSFRAHKLGHDNIRGKKCLVCGLLLGPNASLNIHMRSHTGEKPYQCPTCGKRFSRRSNMMVHHKIHEGIAPVPLKTCNICLRNFTRIGKLKEHLAKDHNMASAPVPDLN